MTPYHPRDIKSGRVWVHDRPHNFKMLEDHLDLYDGDDSDRRTIKRYLYVFVVIASVGVVAWLTK